METQTKEIIAKRADLKCDEHWAESRSNQAFAASAQTFAAENKANKYSKNAFSGLAPGRRCTAGKTDSWPKETQEPGSRRGFTCARIDGGESNYHWAASRRVEEVGRSATILPEEDDGGYH